MRDHRIMITPTSSVNNLFDMPAQGIKRSLGEANNAAQRIAQGDISPDSFSALMQAGVSLKANRAAAITADEMIGTLINRKA